MLKVICGRCGRRFQVDDAHAGRRGRCPGCRAPVIVPGAPRRSDSSCESRAPAGSTITCPACGGVYDAKGRRIGMTVLCPECRTEFVARPVLEPWRKRAVQKLRACRSTGRPAALVGGLTGQTALLLLGTLGPPLLVGVLLWGAGRPPDFVLPVVGLVLLLVTVPVLPLAILAHVRSRPRQPARAVHEFYSALAHRRFRRAYRLVADADKDEFPRALPDHLDRSPSDGAAFGFADEREFRRFWRQIVCTHTLPTCKVRLGEVRVRRLGPDLAAVEFVLTLRTNTDLYWLLILVGCVGLIPGMILQAVTWRTTKARLRRVVVKAGPEWRMFSGEWSAPDEQDLSWVTPSRRPRRR